MFMERINICYEEKELKDEYGYCYKRVPCGHFADGSQSYAYHSCMLREVDYDDGRCTSYRCMIDKMDASVNMSCRHKDLFNKGYKIINEKYILK